MQRPLKSLLLVLLTLAIAAPTLAGSGSKSRSSAGSGSRSAGSGARSGPTPPAIGDAAPTTALTSLSGESVDLATTIADGQTVLVFLRGYPGYQCPICSRIVQGFVREAPAFAQANANVVMVYPGAATDLTSQAQEFLAGAELPAPMSLMLDPDYRLSNAYNIRWNAPNETVYPSTFILDEGKIAWSKVSKTHGGRASAKTVLTALQEITK